MDVSGWLNSDYTTWAFSGADINRPSGLPFRGTESTQATFTPFLEEEGDPVPPTR